MGGLLDEVAAARPPYHTLIDAGALITGLTNLQVARYLLQHGLPSMDGVVFLDEADRKMILLRAGLKVLPLAGCGVSPQRRFTFFDQVHALGVDVDERYRVRAAMTIGKDMTFRDFAQGAFRMRAVGRVNRRSRCCSRRRCRISSASRWRGCSGGPPPNRRGSATRRTSRRSRWCARGSSST